MSIFVLLLPLEFLLLEELLLDLLWEEEALWLNCSDVSPPRRDLLTVSYLVLLTADLRLALCWDFEALFWEVAALWL